MLGIEAAEALDKVGGGSSERGEDGFKGRLNWRANIARFVVFGGASEGRELLSWKENGIGLKLVVESKGAYVLMLWFK